MGGAESSDKERDMRIPEHMAQNFRQSQYLQGDWPVSESDDNRYGPCQFLEVAYDRLVVRKRLRAKDDRQFATFLKNKQQRMSFDANLFVKLLDYDSGAMPEEENENGTYKYFIDCYFEHHPNDLKHEIAERRSNGHHFSGQELKRIAAMFVNAGATLDDAGSRHGDVRPEFVALDVDGKPLLMDNVRDKAGTGGRLAMVSEIDVYLSPLLFKCYSRNVVKYKHDKAKDDVFSAGMVLLEAGILDSVQDCYDKESGKFKIDTLNELLDRFDQIYAGDADLCQRVRRFLVVDEVDRCRFKELAGQSGKSQPAQNQGYQQPANAYNAGYSAGYGHSHQGNYQGSYQGHQTSGYGQQQPTSFPGSPQQGYHQQAYVPQQQVYHSGQNSGFGSPQLQAHSRNAGANPLASRLGNY